MSDAVPVFSTPSPRIRRVAVDRPWVWLAQGWRDFLALPRVSLTAGIGIVVISVLLTALVLISGYVYLLLPLSAGFFFIAPVLAVGLYEASRRREAGFSITLQEAVWACQRNGAQIALMGLVLMLLHLAWVRIATLLFALFFQNTNLSLDRWVETLFFSPVSLPFLVTGGAIGFILAAVAFGIGVVSIPMLLDRDVNVFTAIATSWVAARVNWAAMSLWAALIVVFTVIGLLTFYIGLAITVPLIAHASWHAYRDLVE